MRKVDLFNSALMTLGGDPLSMETDPSRNGKFCRAFYPTAAKTVLRSFSWNCARRRVKLKPLADDDANNNVDLTELTFQYELPEDYLNIVSINGHPSARRLIENDYLYCDYDEINLIYIADITEPASTEDELKYSAGLADAISLYLANRLAASIIKKDPQSILMLKQEYQRALIDAQGHDAMEAMEDEPGQWVVE